MRTPAAAAPGWAAAESWAAAPEENWAAAPEQDWAAPDLRDAVDDFARKREEEIDDFARKRDAGRAVDDAREADDAADRARCSALRAAYAVVPGVSWGTAPAEAQTEWRTRGCDGTG